ncbi:unnamed protein product [Arctia plantaginis]|uniref:Uncharacterized protein n=1 Tax=Arctia plantaginis TaxID=874455 RepID=A0A8S0ZMY7_ARCPL|nr:unnamed protein product [Arctia plantaginis]
MPRNVSKLHWFTNHRVQPILQSTMKRWTPYSKVFTAILLMVEVILESTAATMGFTQEVMVPMEYQVIVITIQIPVHQTVSIPMGRSGVGIVSHAISMCILLVMGITLTVLDSRDIQAMGSRRGIFMR